MAGPKPNDPYSPVPTVPAVEGMGQNYLSARATPNAAGAQIGEALQRGGQAVEGAFNAYMDNAIKEQGMLNETMTTEADNKLYVQQSDLVGKYRSMQGLEAVAAKDATLAALAKSREELAATMPNKAALRAFNLLASRREAFAFSEVNNYAASQVKKASIDSAKASMDLSIASVSNPSVASDDKAFGAAMGDIYFSAAKMVDELGYGASGGTGMKQDPITGTVTFDTTTENGKKGEAVYRDFVNKASGQAWENRLNTLAYDAQYGNIEQAVSVLQQNKTNMPAETYAKMSHAFSGPYRTYQSRGIADSVLAEVERDYSGSVGSAPDLETAITNVFPGTTVTSRGRDAKKNAEVGGSPTSHHLDNNAIDFVPPAGTTTEQIRDVLTSMGINPTELIDEKDHFHVAWKPKGSYIDPTTRFQTKADYVATNYSKLINQAEKRAMEQYKDPVFAQQVRTHTEQRLNDIITQQRLMDKVDQNDVMGYVTGEKNRGQLVTDTSQLESGPPEVRAAWHRMQLTNPIGAERLEKYILTANSQGNAVTYGTDFYKYLQQVNAGEVTSPDQLYDQVRPGDGRNSPLSNTGHRVISRIINESQTPQGKAFLDAQSDFLEKIRPMITRSPAGIKDGIGDSKFNQFLMNALPRIAAGKAKGLTAEDLFNEKSPDYVGKNINIFQRTPSQVMSDTIEKSFDWGSMGQAPSYDTIKDSEALKEALNKDIDSGVLSLQDAREYLVKRGLAGIKTNAPPVPAPSFN